MNNLQQAIEDWYIENKPFGLSLGYPECCVNAFCDQPPEVLKLTKASDSDKMRYHAGCINGEFTGFIPCEDHARKILTGQISLESLIQNRDLRFPPFPYV